MELEVCRFLNNNKAVENENMEKETALYLESQLKSDVGRYKIWNQRELLRNLPIQIIEKSPMICSACAIVEELSDDYNKADEYIARLKRLQILYRANSDKYEEIENYLRCMDIELAHRSTTDLFNKYKLLLEVLEKQNEYKLKPTITLNRPSLLNGARDNYKYASHLFTAKKPLKMMAEKLYQREGCMIFELAKAEALYQENKIAESLSLLSNLIPRLERMKNPELLFVALYLRYCILIVTGQLDSVYCMIDKMKNKLNELDAFYLIPNINAIRVWAAMLDCNYPLIKEWGKNHAPDESGEYCNLDRFQYFIKLRVYLLYGKHMLLVNLAGRMLHGLLQLERHAELCELYTILAMSYYNEKNEKQAFQYLTEALELCRKYKFYRIIANEGSRIYLLLRDYACAVIEDNTVIKLMQMSRTFGLFYPDYLKPKLYKTTTLTATEMDVLRLLCVERSNEEIGTYLDITTRTVKFHVSNIFRKLGVKNRRQAAKAAKKNGIV